MSPLTPTQLWDQGSLARDLTRDQAQLLGNRGSDTPLANHFKPNPIRPILPQCSSKQGSRASLCTP